LTSETRDILVIGYGNPGRLDDGLGPALAGAVERLHLPHVTVDIDYQLNVEHAAAVAAHRTVILLDASVDGAEPFSFRPILPARAPSVDFTSHSLPPRNLLALARDLFNARTAAYSLAVRGYRFNAFREELSPGARRNLDAALGFLTPLLESRSFSRSITPPSHLGTRNAARRKEIEPCPATSS